MGAELLFLVKVLVSSIKQDTKEYVNKNSEKFLKRRGELAWLNSTVRYCREGMGQCPPEYADG